MPPKEENTVKLSEGTLCIRNIATGEETDVPATGGIDDDKQESGLIEED